MDKYSVKIVNNEAGFQSIYRIWDGIEYRVDNVKGVRTYKTEKAAQRAKYKYEATGK
jgi:hypothetical protein